MGFYILLATFITLFICCEALNAGPGKCVGVTSCYCKYDNGQFLDLTTLGQKDGVPRFLNVSDSHEMSYSWNPCFSFSEGACRNVSICAIRPAVPSDIIYPLGYHNSAKFSTDLTGDLTLTYTTAGNAVKPIRNSYINLVCEHSSNYTFKALGPKTQTSLDYYFELRGSIACPQGLPTTTPAPGKGSPLSTGAIGGIVAAVVVVIAASVLGTLFVLRKKGKICRSYDALE